MKNKEQTKKILISIFIVFMFSLISLVLNIYQVYKDNIKWNESKYFSEIYLSNLEKYLLIKNEEGSSNDYLAFEYNFPLNENERFDVWVEDITGEKILINTTTPNCLAEKECASTIGGIVILSITDRYEKNEKIIQLHNIGPNNTVYLPSISINIDKNLETYFEYNEIDASAFIDNNEITIGSISYRESGQSAYALNYIVKVKKYKYSTSD